MSTPDAKEVLSRAYRRARHPNLSAFHRMGVTCQPSRTKLPVSR